MKKKLYWGLLIFGLGIIVGLTISFFLNGSNVIEFPFADSDIKKIEMYHYEGVPAAEECKIITVREDINTLHKNIQNIKVRDMKKNSEPMTGGSVTRFVFVLSNGTEYDLEYCNSESTPTISSKAGDFNYQTSANLEKYWTKLDYQIVNKEPVENLEESTNDETIEAEQTEIYPAKIIYEGCYFDEGVYQYWTSMPLSESPMIYCEIWVSNVTDETFDFVIKEVVMATDERTIILPLSTAKIVNNGWGAIYEGEEFTLTFEFPDAPDIFPKFITVDGWKKLEGNNYMNNKIPGHESG